MILKGTHVYLRALEPTDVDFLFDVENDTSLWEVSGTIAPFSKHVLQEYIANAHLDIFEIKQLRLVICDKKNTAIGLIDLFDFDPLNRRVGVGVMVESQSRNKGVAEEALTVLINYAFTVLNVKQLYANVGLDNKPSLALFAKVGFVQVGVKKDWVLVNGTFKDEVLLQKINS